ncbi:hypothetical protein BpHYR1_021280 [Brachionus plicatilis]|uniref:Uncharacterized protein n=1 Tax=Brachionus plicatilis TaxID=10195 RepID=A0A3M7PJP8_BRAPC|nr:hypothetical protein BpHYR1_021280 [Brachionus plicatilis]
MVIPIVNKPNLSLRQEIPKTETNIVLRFRCTWNYRLCALNTRLISRKLNRWILAAKYSCSVFKANIFEVESGRSSRYNTILVLSFVFVHGLTIQIIFLYVVIINCGSQKSKKIEPKFVEAPKLTVITSFKSSGYNKYLERQKYHVAVIMTAWSVGNLTLI